MASKKKELILATEELIKEKNFNDITIKEIAEKASCTSAVIYKHFDNLEHLLTCASVYFLEAYALDAQEISKKDYTPMELEYILWGVFANYALHNVDAFDLLFWKYPKEVIEKCIYEYYQLFPDNWKNFTGMYATMLMGSDLKERNAVMLRWAATSGFLNYDDVAFLAELQCTYLYGLMMEIRRDYRKPGVAEEALERFKFAIKSTEDHYRIDK